MKGVVLTIIFLILTFSGCVEQIELDAPTQGDQIVIFGGINSVGISEQIEIYRTSTIQNRVFPIVGATVSVKDDFGSEARMFGDAEGVYKFGSRRVTLIPGREYFIDIVFLNGDRYQSRPQKLPTARAVERVSGEFKETETINDRGVVITDRVLELSGTTGVINPNDDDFFFRWEVQETYVLRPTDFPDPFSAIPPPFYFTSFINPQRITIFDGEGIRLDTLGSKVLGVRDLDYSFLDRHFFTTISHSITKEAYNFWNQVDVLTNATGSIFDLPPARVVGNMYNVNDPDEIVLGFFEVANSTISRFFTVVSDSPFPVPESGCDYDMSDPFLVYPPYCLECLPEDGCSTNRPPFFNG